MQIRVVDAIKIVLGFFYAGLTFSLPIAIGWMVPMSWRRVIFYWPWRIFALGICVIFRLEPRVRGREKIKPRSHRGHLFICNHQSALDIPLLVSFYPIPFLTKRQNLFIPFLGLAGLLAGSIAFDRDKTGERRRVIERIIDRATRHTSLFIFPEGTRSRTGELQPRVYPALLRAAWRAGIKIVPIGLHGSYRITGYKPPAGTWGRYPVAIEVGETIEPGQFDNDRVFADYCWQRVAELHRRAAAEVSHYYGPLEAKRVGEPLPAWRSSQGDD